jgi:hypothetical protein
MDVCVFVCCTVKTKGKIQENKGAQRSTDKVKRKKDRIKKFWWKQDFTHPYRPALGKEYIFRGIKRPGYCVHTHPHPASRLKKE